MTESPRRFLGVLGLGLAVLAALGLAAGIRQRLQPVKVAVGVDRPLVYGAAVDSSNVAVDRFLKAHQQRFGYQPYAMGLGTRQAMELLDQAFRLGLRTPAAVKRHLLQNQPHQTSLGAIRFTPSGDVEGTYHFLRP